MSVMAGIISLDGSKPIGRENLLPMLEAMRPAIPCDIETYVMADKTAAIGRVSYGPDTKNREERGSVIGHTQVFCVGELYNDDIWNSDSTESYLLDRYVRFGSMKFAEGLNGSFSAVVADPNDRSFTLVTDYVDSFPIFTLIHNNRLYFASEVKAFMAVKDIPTEIDPAAVISLATSGSFVGCQTLIKTANKMDYATVCRIQNGEVSSYRYWEFNVEPERQYSHMRYLNDLTDLLIKAVDRRTRHGRVAVMLSGGHDSRGIVAALREPSRVPGVIFSLRTKETRSELGDWAIAERVAAQAGMEVSVFNGRACDFASAIEASVCASDGAAGFVFQDVWNDIRQTTGHEYLLWGDTCMRWRTHALACMRDIMDAVELFSLKDLVKLHGLIRTERQAEFVEQSESEIQAVIDRYRTHSLLETAYDTIYMCLQMMHVTLPKRHILSHHGLMVRNPWLDLDVMNFVKHLPLDHSRKKLLYRQSTAGMAPALFAIPMASAAEKVDYLRYIAAYEQEEQGMTRLILDDNPLLGDYFDTDAIRKLIEKVCTRQSVGTGRASPSLLWSLRKRVPMPFKDYLLRYFRNPYVPSDVTVLLQIATAAVTVRHFSRMTMHH